MRGRPRKPVAQHLLDDTFRSDRHGETPWLPDGKPLMPNWLSAEAKALWKSLVPSLTGIATKIDSAELAALCDWWALYRQNREALDVIEDRQSSAYYKLLQLAGMSWNNFSGIAAKFGLSPSDRAKLQVSPPEKVSDFSRDRNEDRRPDSPLDSQ